MIATIALIVIAFYLYVANWIGRAIYRRTQRGWHWVMVTAVLAVLPFNDVILGYFAFEKFSREHPGTQSAKTHAVDSVLIEGRAVSSTYDAFNSTSLLVDAVEFPREQIALLPIDPPRELLKYVQFKHMPAGSPECLNSNHTSETAFAAKRCVGVTSSDRPVSRYALFEEPDKRRRSNARLFDTSGVVPVSYTHSRVREVETGVVIAEVWSFAIRAWWWQDFVWFARSNPPQFSAASALTPGE